MTAPAPLQTAEPVPFAPEHLPGALALSQAAHWPHRPQDWRMVAQLSEGWAIVRDGRVVATAFATPYGPDCHAVNLIIVDEAMRGRGLGRRITQKAMTPALSGEARLVATAEGRPLYEKLGFVATHDIHQHQGRVGDVARPGHVTWDDAPDPMALSILDEAAFGAPRAALIGELLACGRVATIREGGRIAGFAVRRAFGRGDVIGPVVAASGEEAQALIAFCAADSAGDFLRIDAPDRFARRDWLTSIGLPRIGGGVAMIRQPKTAATGPQTIFALASQALG